MYNIQKAVSRLDFAPKVNEIEITDIKKGLAVFTAKPDKPVSFAALKAALKKAGYKLATANLTVAGTLNKEGDVWIVVAKFSRQKFVLEGPNVETVRAGRNAGAAIETTGDWKTVGEGTSAREVITLTTTKQAADNPFFARFVSARFMQTEDNA